VTATKGFAVQLQEGDVLVRIGGLAHGRQYKRYLINDTVADVYRTPRARVRMHMRLERLGEYVLRYDYPVEYLRGAEADAVKAGQPAKPEQLTDQAFEAAKAAGAAKRAARLAAR
jgi:hypothetical protein